MNQELLAQMYEAVFGYGELEKSASVKESVVPMPHQAVAVQQFLDNNGEIILAHGTGSGKTATSLLCFDAAKRLGRAKRALVVVPTGLRTNYAEKGVRKFTGDSVQIFGGSAEAGDGKHVTLSTADPETTYSVVGYDLFRRDPVGYMKAAGADTLICDEVHKARDPNSSNFRALLLARAMANNFIGMTGSVVSNKPSDVVALLTLSAGYPIAGSQTAFERRYTQVIGAQKGFLGGKKDVTVVTRPYEIQQRFGKLISFVTHQDLERINPGRFPRKVEESVLIEMSPEQQQLYSFAMGKVPDDVRRKIELGLPMDKQEAQTVFGRIIQARQAANSIATLKDVPLEQAADRTPKIRKVLDDATDHLSSTPDGQVVMYSNLVEGGADVLAAGLRQRDIPFGVFVGKGRELGGQVVDENNRQQAVQDYLSGKNRVLIVSGAGAEGLDLKNTTMVQMVDGHFNPEVNQQAVARGVRIGGLSNRPPEARMVVIKKYLSVMPKATFWQSLFGRGQAQTTDQWIQNVAKEKDVLNEGFRTALQTGQRPPFQPPPGFRPRRYLRRWQVHTPTGPEWRYAYGKE